MSTRAAHASLSEMLLPEFDVEMALSRKALERVPEDRFDWKPHAKSPTLGWLATFLAVLPSWTVATLKQDALDLAPQGKPQQPLPPKTTRREVLELFDRNVADARVAIAATSDQSFAQPWTLLQAGKPLLTRARSEVLRS